LDLLLAEGDLTLSYKTVLAVGGVVATVASTLAVLKLKAKWSEDKHKSAKNDSKETTAELKAKDDKIEAAIKGLGDKMDTTGDVLKSKIVDLERRQGQELDAFESKVMSRFDKVDGQLSDHEKRIAVAENDRTHMKAEHKRVASKVTRFPGGDS